MALHHRVLAAEPILSLADYIEHHRGGKGLEAARAVEPDAVIEELAASGLRGRGGAGFPTGTKWRTVRANRSDVVAATVVVNAAEGEPGTFKDRAILRANPYHVLEGALIAAHVLDASDVVVAVKQTFVEEATRVRAAIDEIAAAGWCDSVKVTVFEGPGDYLYGEETALLEVIDGRPPLPRIAPPYRRGAVEVVEDEDDLDSDIASAAPVEMADPSGETVAPATLVDNVETLANVPGIVSRGAAWFREVGTADSPGTLVCTITGAVRAQGVGEVAMGTPLGEAIAAISGEPLDGHPIVAVLPGVANALIPAARLDTPLTYEAMAAAGSGLGSGGYLVLGDTTDPVAVIAGASRFLADESCAQCTPCKEDGTAIADLLAALAQSDATTEHVAAIGEAVVTVTDGARCNLAAQQQAVVRSLLELFPSAVDAHIRGVAEPVAPCPTGPLSELDGGVGDPVVVEGPVAGDGDARSV